MIEFEFLNLNDVEAEEKYTSQGSIFHHDIHSCPEVVELDIEASITATRQESPRAQHGWDSIKIGQD